MVYSLSNPRYQAVSLLALVQIMLAIEVAKVRNKRRAQRPKIWNEALRGQVLPYDSYYISVGHSFNGGALQRWRSAVQHHFRFDAAVDDDAWNDRDRYQAQSSAWKALPNSHFVFLRTAPRSKSWSLFKGAALINVAWNPRNGDGVHHGDMKYVTVTMLTMRGSPDDKDDRLLFPDENHIAAEFV